MTLKVYVISDGTGKTAEGALKSAMAQFGETDTEIRVRAKVRTEKQVEQIIDEAKNNNGFVVHTIVSKNLRDRILALGRLNEVETIDLMGPLLAQLSRQLDYSPLETPGMFRKLNRAYFQRIESMEFAFRHDDGNRAEEIDKGEIILIGVSRTFKTPLSIYLAFKGWRVANVPIVLGLDPPPKIFNLQGVYVFGLTTSPKNLAELRSVRDQYLGGATGQYSDIDYVRAELRYACKIFERIRDCQIIDVTNKPIEEIASDILARIKSRGGKTRPNG
ncbi:MAG TPA: kinase/pyrophosphorylase [Candidatus Aminicenantes bacterium]|nr:kinase/pyrophosphorylase [Candidatus Aminicenantes bacterium]